MGKKQHSKDRMFITKTEWAAERGGAKSKESGTPFKRLPFYCCALTFTPFEVPVATADGSVFDIINIIPYINKYGRHPVTGAPLKKEDLISLTFHKNPEGEFQCPVLNKVFTEFTHIVAVKTTGNVFCYEAIKELNIKTKNWKELLTDEPFTKEDIITIQSPNALDSKVLLDFDHVKKNLKVEDEELKKMESEPSYKINVIGDIKQMLKELGTEKAKEIALHGGGGNKAKSQRAAALEAILEARSRIKEDNGKPKQAYSIVDVASAAVHGRSAAAAKVDASIASARIAVHMAGERAPVNAKLKTGQPHRRSMGGGRSSSSGEEDGNAEWRAAIASVTSTTSIIKHDSNGLPSSFGGHATNEDNNEKQKPQNIKHYQIKAQKLLEDLLEKTIEVVTETAHIVEKDPTPDDYGVQLFKCAPRGIVFDHVEELHGPKKKPKIVPGEEIHENSKKFRKQLQSVSVDGADIIAAARAEGQKSLAKVEAREATAKAASQREEERVAELKRIRGERWLPSVAR